MAKEKKDVTESTEQEAAQTAEIKDGDQANAQFAIQRIYTKDISFESPQAPKLFKEKEWNPEINLEINTKSRPQEQDIHEVVLRITVTATVNETTAFIAEIQQAGLFYVAGLQKEQMRRTLGTFCPSILYPYAREVVTDLVQRGGFPPLYLAPVNFDALYEKHQQDAGKGSAPASEPVH